ncbi:hypothetical protein [Scytonema hofmannii]|uniref:hypothetical protein n=1 Tax=Scytonema hofmannii TaxID=34078 RepID=UPI00034D7C72|nr:hypothetical protein [Scytonema hofmannii]
MQKTIVCDGAILTCSCNRRIGVRDTQCLFFKSAGASDTTLARSVPYGNSH